VIWTSSSAAKKPAAANCHQRSRCLSFPRHNRYEIKTIEDLLVINGGNGKRSKAHAGKVGTGVLARIAVKQCVGIVHSALFTRPLALWRLAHAAKTTGRATSRRVGILANVANVAARFGPGS
jgi:hypothetical protein